jgi:ribonucleoside-diphosphate reductase alpha chain
MPKNIFAKIKKRDGRIVSFDISKISNAIFKASESAGKPEFTLSKELAEEVVNRLLKKRKIQKSYVPTIEEIQDTVEHVLIDRDYNKIVKEYILYRQKRAEIRKEKAQILNKKAIDEVDKKFSVNSLRVLVSRYLKKDDNGRVIESPKELFIRVAVHTALPYLFYDKEVYQNKEKATIHKDEEFLPEKEEGKYKIGEYVLNQYHLEAMKRIYDRSNHSEDMKITWKEFLERMKKGYFDKYSKQIDEYYNLMVERKFLPNTPVLANFGSFFGMGSACYVLGIEDSIDSIMETLKSAALIFKSGGGAGYNFSNLRPSGDFVKTSGGVASGPISFMSLYDKMTEVIKQGGIRRGANMGILNSNHPDIEGFIKCKTGNKEMRNFNLSVLILPEFWQCLKEKKPYPLINPKNKKIVKYIDPKSLFNLISYQAWESGEPGVIFFDHVNQYNPLLKELGPIVSTNPCGEVLLYPFESCNLGSINLWTFIKRNNGDCFFDWDKYSKTIEIATKFLDNVIDVNKYPLPEVEEMTMKTRKIGLGVMGLADTLFELGISYNSKEGLKFMERIVETLNYYSKTASIKISRERGRFPLFDKSFYPQSKLPFSGYKEKENVNFNWKELTKKIKRYGLRNAFTTVIAPTGSISMIAGCSSGIEPNYSLVFEKNVAVGSFYYVNPIFERIIQRNGLFKNSLIRKIINNKGTVQNIPSIPKKLKDILVTAMDISPEDHIRALGSLQKWVDSSISKTNNLPADATPEDIKKIYLLAYKLGCKDVTVFRDTSIKDQVLIAGGKTKEKDSEIISKKDNKTQGFSVYFQPNVLEISEINKEDLEMSKKFCLNCHTELTNQEGCHSCPICGWGTCS